MNEVLLSIIASIVGAIIYAFFQSRYNSYQGKRSEHSGSWETIIYAEADSECIGNEIKKDQMAVRGKHHEIYGTIRRAYPTDESSKRWSFVGRISGETMICIFWSKSKSVGSCGCWLQRFDKNRNGYRGYYLKYDYEKHKICAIPLATKKMISAE